MHKVSNKALAPRIGTEVFPSRYPSCNLWLDNPCCIPCQQGRLMQSSKTALASWSHTSKWGGSYFLEGALLALSRTVTVLLMTDPLGDLCECGLQLMSMLLV